jgi:hypothetical protein
MWRSNIKLLYNIYIIAFGVYASRSKATVYGKNIKIDYFYTENVRFSA